MNYARGQERINGLLDFWINGGGPNGSIASVMQGVPLFAALGRGRKLAECRGVDFPSLASQFPQTRRSLRERQSTCGHPVPSRACCCYTTRCSPRCAWGTPGTLFHGDCGTHTPLNLCPAVRIERMADPKGVAPSAFPQTTGCSAIELRVQNRGKCW